MPADPRRIKELFAAALDLADESNHVRAWRGNPPKHRPGLLYLVPRDAAQR